MTILEINNIEKNYINKGLVKEDKSTDEFSSEIIEVVTLCGGNIDVL